MIQQISTKEATPVFYGSLPVNHPHKVTREALIFLGQNPEFVKLWTDVETKYGCPIEIIPLTHEKVLEKFRFDLHPCFNYDPDQKKFSSLTIFFHKEETTTLLSVIGVIAYDTLYLNQIDHQKPGINLQKIGKEEYAEYYTSDTKRLRDEFFKRGVENGYFKAEGFTHLWWSASFSTLAKYLFEAEKKVIATRKT